MSTNLIEWVFLAEESAAEDLSDALLWAGCLAVSVEDAQANTEEENPIFGEPGLEPSVPAWAHNRVIATVAADADFAEILSTATELYGEPLPDYSLRTVPDLDWVRLTQSQFQPIAVSERLWIVPSWHQAGFEAPPSAINLELDPGLAFGTGSHPTTFLCLQWLDAHLARGASVLDYGCGSGILAIAADKLGAASVLGIDIDPQAVQASMDNAQRNQALRCEFAQPDVAIQTYQTVVANILTTPLKMLAPMLCQAVQTGGNLVLSGVLARQADEVIAAYAPWIALSVWRERDGWVCLAGQK